MSLFKSNQNDREVTLYLGFDLQRNPWSVEGFLGKQVEKLPRKPASMPARHQKHLKGWQEAQA